MKWDSTRVIKSLTILWNNSIHTRGNWDKMDQLFAEHELLQVTQYEIDNLYSPVSIMEIEFIIKNSLPTIPTPRWFHWRILSSI